MKLLIAISITVILACPLLAQEESKPEKAEKQPPAAEEQPEKILSPEEIDAAIKALSSRFDDERKEARKKLIKAGEPAAKPLIEVLKSDIPARRAAAADILGFIGGEAAAPALVKLIRDEDLTVREEARKALARIGPAAVKYLAEALEEGTEEQRKEFQKAVKRMVETIIKNLVGRDPAGNPEYGDYPGQFKDILRIGKHATPTLIDIAKNSDVNPYRFLAISALGRLGDKSAVPALKKLFEDEYVRDESAISLSQLGDDSLVKKVIEDYQVAMIKDPERAYVSSINLALLYHKLEKWKEAETEYKHAIELEPDQPSAYYNYACLLSVRNRTKEALDSLAKALDKGWDSGGWLLRDGELENVRKLPEFKELFEKHFGKATGAE